MKHPPKLTIEPLKGGYYRVFLDDFEITHCLGLNVAFEMETPGGSWTPTVAIKLFTIVDAVNMERLSAINTREGIDEAPG